MPSTFVIFYLLAHLLFLVLSSESFLLVWSSRQWKGNCLDQLSSICIFQRHHLSLKSIHSFSRTQNNLWSNSFVFSILKQKCFMPSTHLTASERCMCPGCFASHTFTCRIPASLAANATLLSVAFADVCEGSAAISSCSPGQPPAPYCLPPSLPASRWGSAVPTPWVSAVVWVIWGDLKLSALHLCAITGLLYVAVSAVCLGIDGAQHFWGIFSNDTCFSTL